MGVSVRVLVFIRSLRDPKGQARSFKAALYNDICTQNLDDMNND